MVRNYVKKSDKCNWNDGVIHLAIQKLKDGQSCLGVATSYGIPRSTLQQKFKQYLDDPTSCLTLKKVGYKRTFNEEQEEALVRTILQMETKMFGLNGTDVRKLAYQFAEKIGIRHRFNKTKEMAGKDWIKSFMKRHNLSHRKAEHTSSARFKGFSKSAVEQFFTLLAGLKDKFTPDRIFNVDETGVSVVPKSSPKVIAKKGRKQVGGLTAQERGENVTAEICMSASGVYMPPLLIFPRVKENLEFLKDAPAGAWAEFHKSGYMQTDIFTRWFEKFIEFTHATPENPVLLLLDGHSTHIKNLKILDLAQDNGVEILCFPPHCTHKMQPLDVGFNGPLNIAMGKEIADFQRQGNRVTLKYLYYIFGRAFAQAAKMSTAINSFKKCGISPYDANVFDGEFPDDESQDSNQPQDIELEENIATFQNTIQEIIYPEREREVNQFTNNSAPENAIMIPLSYIQPLLDFLNSAHKVGCHQSSPKILDSIDTIPASTTNDTFMSSSNDIPDSIVNDISTPSTSADDKKGKAVIITSDSYRKKLMSEKLCSIKKEKHTKSSVKKIAKVIKSVSENPKLRKPLQSLENSLAFQSNLDTTTNNESPIQGPFFRETPLIPIDKDTELQICYMDDNAIFNV
ncbi:hypothetical protein TKK_0000245 [Trichogramma kaykai]|uniref:HTH CENPB-type domain-containing protein n=1 Tax=Trichogramma kaykai TaxID=54128 RepID=A0ABD2VUN3_9HYME